MKLKIFLVLLLCVLQHAHYSKSTKTKGGNRLKKIFKNCLIAVAVDYGANEVVNAGKPQVADSNSLDCKYNVPDQNAGVMMNFVRCAKDQDFEKYMSDNSENCPKIRELYKQTESDGNCDLNIPKIIPNGALVRFRGEKLSHATNVEMLKVHLLSYPGKYGALFESEKSVSDFLRKLDASHKIYFDFFQFTSMLELIKLAFPNDTNWTVVMALLNEYKDTNLEHAKKLFELTRIAFPNDARKAVAMTLQSEYKDVNVEHARRVLELTNLAFPNNTGAAVAMALHSEYKDVNVEHAKHVLELTNFVYPNDTGAAVAMALDSEYKDVNLEHARRMLILTNLAFPNDTGEAVAMALQIEYKDVNVDNAKRVLELTKVAFFDMEVAVKEALKPKYQNINVGKVNKKYQELKNSWSWYLSSEQTIMKEVLKVIYPEIVKEDF